MYRIALRKLHINTHNVRRSLHLFFRITAILFFVFACTNNQKNDERASTEIDYERIAKDNQILLAKEKARQIAESLDFYQLAAQMIISGIDGKGQLTHDMQALLEGIPVGGIILFRYNLDSSIEGIQSLCQEVSALVAKDGIAPFIAVDHEGGTVNRFRPSIAALPPAGSYWELAQSNGYEQAIAQIEQDSFRAGLEISSMGINLNLAPVAEAANNYNGAFLGSRSYGPDSSFCAEAAAAFIRGMEKAGMLCAVKHFPGSAGPDPHLFSQVIELDSHGLDNLISPFAVLIRAGQGRALMISHTLVRAKDPDNIASLSPAVMQNWLRHELGFEGIIIADDFSMAAASNPAAANSPAAGSLAAGRARLSPAEAAVKSLAAGASMVLVWPPDLRKTHRAIQAALQDGSLPPDQLRESAARIIFEKIMMESGE